MAHSLYLIDSIRKVAKITKSVVFLPFCHSVKNVSFGEFRHPGRHPELGVPPEARRHDPVL